VMAARFGLSVSPKIGREMGKVGENRRVRRGDLPQRDGSCRQTGRNLDIRPRSCERITDPWPTQSAAVGRSAQGQARAAVPSEPLRVVCATPPCVTRHAPSASGRYE
jgi:hypothetical protein